MKDDRCPYCDHLLRQVDDLLECPACLFVFVRDELHGDIMEAEEQGALDYCWDLGWEDDGEYLG